MKNVIFLLWILFCVSPASAQVTFKDVTPTSGITTPSTSSSSFTNSWADFDNDDYWDLFIARGNLGNDQVPQVFHNLRNGSFTEITNTAFPNLSPGYYAHMCFGDFDNDGFVDCFQDAFVSSVNKLWRNNGDLTFSDVSTMMQNPGGRTVGTIWTDYDEDGFVDLIVSAQAGQGTMCYHNNAGKSLDMVNVFDNPQVGDIVLTADINNDGWPDLYIHDDFVPDLFLVNQSSAFQAIDNSFDVKEFGINNRITAAFGDIDNDGYPDFLLAMPEKFVIWHNDSGRGFHNWTDELKLTNAPPGDHRMSFIQDVDNDGYLDIILYDNIDASQIWYGGPQGFTMTLAPFFSNSTSIPSSLSWTDYDNDGFIDFLDVSLGKTKLWRNQGNSNRWLNVKLRGHKANSMGLGSMVNVYYGGKKQDREVGFYQSYYGYQPAMAHFGFGSPSCTASSDVIDSVVVIWQPGGRQVIRNVPYNELAVIDQDSGIVRSIQRPVSVAYGYASPYFLGAKSVYADTLVTVPMAVEMPKNFVQQQVIADEITFGIAFNSDIIDITPSKVVQRYTPPAGWAYKSSAMSGDSLVITISNTGNSTIPDSLGLGSLRFDTYATKLKSTYLFLNTLIIRVKGNEYKFCHNYEGDFLGEVIIIDRPAGVVTANTGTSWGLTVSPNPVSGSSATVRYPSTKESRSAKISVFDVLGKEVYRTKTESSETLTDIHTCTIPTSQLSGGTYLLRLSVGGEVMAGKFTVVR